MKKMILNIFGLLLVFGSILFPVSLLAQGTNEDTDQKVEEVSSFELFWPIVAGRTAGDPLYFLKSLKENLRGMLIFSDYRKTDYHMTLSEKRAVELEKLLELKDFDNAKKTLNMSGQERTTVKANLKQLADEGTNTTDLKATFNSSLNEQKKLFVYLLSKSSDDMAKEIINSFLSSVESDLSSIK